MVEMSPENRDYLESSIASGVYPNALAALDEAMLLLRRRDDLRSKLQAGIEQADRGELLPSEEVFTRLEQRAAEIQRQAQESQ